MLGVLRRVGAHVRKVSQGYTILSSSFVLVQLGWFLDICKYCGPLINLMAQNLPFLYNQYEGTPFPHTGLNSQSSHYAAGCSSVALMTYLINLLLKCPLSPKLNTFQE